MIAWVLRSGVLFATALAAAMLGPAPVLAAPALDGTFVQLYTGLGLTEDSELRVRVPGEGFDLTFSRVSWEDHSLSRPSIPYIGVRVGRFCERWPWLGLAVDIIHYKVFAKTDRIVEVRGTIDGGHVNQVRQQTRTFHMTQKLHSQSAAVMGAFDQSWNIAGHKGALRIHPYDPKHGIPGRERVRPHLRLGSCDARQ